MKQKISNIFDLISNMGLRYVFFRIGYLIQTKTGLLKLKFPTKIDVDIPISLDEWKKESPAFFVNGREIMGLTKEPNAQLQKTYNEIRAGIYTFFSYRKYKVQEGELGWFTNPSNGYVYDSKKHWTQIEDLSKEAGDIKFVWEKARFSFIYDIIRYDYHFENDSSEFIFSQIESFIDHNPLNLGPQYKCSQEISLRILNWTYVLYFYKDSEHLTDALFKKILKSIYGQLHHVYNNIHFSRISVRNNHAITETMTLFLSGLLFPFIKDTKKWSSDGKKWFEEEVAYQIYKDGTFLQYSMNYHRVVIQLLTWAIGLTRLHNIQLSKVVYERAERSLDFLDACTDLITGMLPNYGANDGALFFKFTNDDYRVYTSQLNDLRSMLKGVVSREEESVFWYGNHKIKKQELDYSGIYSFQNGGYYILQEENVKTFLKCGAYKDRPSQADNLHLDIWVDGVNFLWDTGSYKYNTDTELIKYFNGSAGHNTISVNGQDQMLKGGRFIWYKWVKEARGSWKITQDSDKDAFLFEGYYDGFKQIGGIRHERKVFKHKGSLEWYITDLVKGKTDIVEQFWHINPKVEKYIKISCYDNEGNKIMPIRESKYYSSYYGVKEESIRLTFKSSSKILKTKITIDRPY